MNTQLKAKWYLKTKQMNKIFVSQMIKQKVNQQQNRNLQIKNKIKSLEQRDDISSIKRQFYQSQLKSELVKKLEKIGKAQIVQIPHMNQNLEISNPELMLYVLRESLEQDQNRKHLITDCEDSCGLESLISVYGNDQECLSFRSSDIEYETFCNDQEYRNSYIRTFQEKVSQIFEVPSSDIEILKEVVYQDLQEMVDQKLKIIKKQLIFQKMYVVDKLVFIMIWLRLMKIIIKVFHQMILIQDIICLGTTFLKKRLEVQKTINMIIIFLKIVMDLCQISIILKIKVII
ncbi:unnamed protein product [Paramecium sonneborni]|uniref:Uncharacterized protein n=1 Tax=Paramecium sonneborni TaxID=65129 RepID=A0A8S1RJT4_9CILI|nr:unnamed protein product [Paramecium sonneborni]